MCDKSSFDRAKAARAKACYILVNKHSKDPNASDRSNILNGLALKNYLMKNNIQSNICI